MLEPNQLALVFAALNAVAFVLYGIDKLKAKRGSNRIAERTLLLSSLLAASPGALLGMVLFNHKTSKPKFRYGVPALLVLHAAVAYWVAYY